MSDDRCPEHDCDIAVCFEEHNMKGEEESMTELELEHLSQKSLNYSALICMKVAEEIRHQRKEIASLKTEAERDKSAARLAFDTLAEERDHLRAERERHIEAAAHKELDWFAEKRRADLLEAKCAEMTRDLQSVFNGDGEAMRAILARTGKPLFGPATTAQLAFLSVGALLLLAASEGNPGQALLDEVKALRDNLEKAQAKCARWEDSMITERGAREEMQGEINLAQAKCSEAVQWAVEWTIKQLSSKEEWPQSWEAGFPSYKASALLSCPHNLGQPLLDQFKEQADRLEKLERVFRLSYKIHPVITCGHCDLCKALAACEPKERG